MIRDQLKEAERRADASGLLVQGEANEMDLPPVVVALACVIDRARELEEHGPELRGVAKDLRDSAAALGDAWLEDQS